MLSKPDRLCLAHGHEQASSNRGEACRFVFLVETAEASFLKLERGRLRDHFENSVTKSVTK